MSSNNIGDSQPEIKMDRLSSKNIVHKSLLPSFENSPSPSGNVSLRNFSEHGDETNYLGIYFAFNNGFR